MLLCLGHLRKHFPTRLVTYRSLREYWQANIYKIEEALDKACNDEPITKPEFVELIPLLQVKKCCDEIMGRSLSRETWSNWKQHIGIPKNSKGVESGKAALLVYMACWRQDHWTTEFPSMKQLLWMMGEATRLGMTIDTFSSGKMQHQWEMQGCKGEELPRYLAAHGYRISVFTLYKWGEGTFSKKKHYSVSELGEWKRRASKCRKYAA
ncbi:MAG TPA: hypothetical protein VE956_00070 [Nodularia sp. (in: cyanobacteria)]|nr:hypothetical protein [Nodularia sp. (in: cyanobacteria)]